MTMSEACKAYNHDDLNATAVGCPACTHGQDPNAGAGTPLKGTVEHPVEEEKGCDWEDREAAYSRAHLARAEAGARKADEWESTLSLAGCVKDATNLVGWRNKRAEEAEARLEWLAENEASLMTHREMMAEGYAIYWTVVKRGKSISGHPLGSPQAAIDFAMGRKSNVTTESSSVPQDAAKWISVKDRAPEEKQDILYVVQGRAHSEPTVVRGMRCYEINAGWWWCDEEGVYDDFGNDGQESFVSWWMPTPTAPLNLEQPKGAV
jgi:hypothetical protein